MINVKFGPHMVDCRGHAGSAPKGSDLVCAAVTIILYALKLGLATLSGVDTTTLDLAEGNGHIEADWVPPEGEGMFTMAKEALTCLALKFPEYIQLAEPIPHMTEGEED